MSFTRLTLPEELDAACKSGDYDAAIAQLDSFRAEHISLSRQDALVQIALRALNWHHTDFYKACVEKGGMVLDPAAKQANQEFAFKAVECDDLDMLKLYLEKGELPMDIGSSLTGDLLNEAAMSNAVTVATWLLEEKGFDVNSDKTMYEQPIPVVQAASGPDEYDDTRFLKLLLKHGVTFKGTGAINEAAIQGYVQAIYVLLAAGADIEEEVTHGMLDQRMDLGTPLWLAAANGELDALEYLIDQGANIQYRDPRQHQTVLEVAKARGHDDCVEAIEKALTEMQ